MIYAKVCDASALERLDAALCQATSLKWYRRSYIHKYKQYSIINYQFMLF